MANLPPNTPIDYGQPANVAKVFTGARAVVSVDGVDVGIFESCSYGANLMTEAVHILGAFVTQEIVPTSYSEVTVNCSGFRVLNNGPHTVPKFPRLQDLLNLGSVTLSIRDRQSGQQIAEIIGCVPTSYSTGVNARSSSRLNITYMGRFVSDEGSFGQAETNNPAILPTP